MGQIQKQARNRIDQEESNHPKIDIAVLFKPKDVRTKDLYNVPIGAVRTFRLLVLPRIGSGFTVEIAQPQATWMRVQKKSGKPPFQTTVEIDTHALEPASIYAEDVVFTVNGVTIHREPILLSTQFYDPDNLPDAQLYEPLNPGEAKKNRFLSLLSFIDGVTHFAIVGLVLLAALFVLLIIVVIIGIAVSI